MSGNRNTRPSQKNLRRSVEEASAQLQAQKPKVTFVSRWLSWRYNQNGFGDDFELSLIPKEAK